MNYVISDPHGQDERFFKMLKLINFSNEDTLIIIGDVASRGPGSIKIFKHIMKSDNMMMLCGNHEVFMLDYFNENGITYNKDHPWLNYGGGHTYNELIHEENPLETFSKIAKFIEMLPIFFLKTVNEKTYFFCHSEAHFENGDISKYQTKEEILWGDISKKRPIILKDDMYLVTGHLRTRSIDKKGSCDIFFEKSWILLDGGCGFDGGQLNCLRLEDLKTFKVQ